MPNSFAISYAHRSFAAFEPEDTARKKAGVFDPRVLSQALQVLY